MVGVQGQSPFVGLAGGGHDSEAQGLHAAESTERSCPLDGRRPAPASPSLKLSPVGPAAYFGQRREVTAGTQSRTQIDAGQPAFVAGWKAVAVDLGVHLRFADVRHRTNNGQQGTRLEARCGLKLRLCRSRGTVFEHRRSSVSPCQSSGGYEIRTREGVNPTRFPTLHSPVHGRSQTCSERTSEGKRTWANVSERRQLRLKLRRR